MAIRNSPEPLVKVGSNVIERRPTYCGPQKEDEKETKEWEEEKKEDKATPSSSPPPSPPVPFPGQR